MIFVRLPEHMVELPTATALIEVDGQVVLTDASGAVIARFDKPGVLAWSTDPEKIGLGLEAQGARLQQSAGHHNGT